MQAVAVVESARHWTPLPLSLRVPRESRGVLDVTAAVTGITVGVTGGTTVRSNGQSISRAWCVPVYSANNAVTPHGLGTCTALADSGLYGVSAAAPPMANVASLPLILASMTFDHSPWMQIRDVPAGLLNV